MRFSGLVLASIFGISCASAPVVCTKPLVYEAQAPGVTPSHNTAAHWINTLGASADQVLMNQRQIQSLNLKNRARRAGFQDVLNDAIAEPTRVAAEIKERFDWLAKRLDDKRFIEEVKGSFARARKIAETAKSASEIVAIHRESTLYCIPMASGLFKPPIDRDFDRNRCSGLHPGELARVMRRGTNGWLYLHVGHSVGWVPATHATPPIPAEKAKAYYGKTPRLVVTADGAQTPNGIHLRMGISFPFHGKTADGQLQIEVPTPEGLQTTILPPSAPVRVGFAPFTRRKLLTLAFQQLNQPYGWGGYRGGRDCSRFVMDMFAVFGIQIGRHSGVQARAGVRTIDVTGLSDAEKSQTLEKAGDSGIVLLYMPGHIMLYLNESNGRPYAVSSISEFLRPCRSGAHQVVRLDRIAVTDLELGRQTKRTAFLERLSKLAVFSQ